MKQASMSHENSVITLVLFNGRTFEIRPPAQQLSYLELQGLLN